MFRNLSLSTIETSFLADQRRGLNSLNSASDRDHCHCSIGFRFSIFIYVYVQFSMFAVQFMFSSLSFIITPVNLPEEHDFDSSEQILCYVEPCFLA